MNSINILLVEDNEGDILLATEALEENGISSSVNVVKDGCEALMYLEKKGKYANVSSPELILLDINLPKLNGHEVLKNIKTSEELKHLPVIMLSTSNSKEDIFNSYRLYANCYIPKPMGENGYSEVIASINKFWGSVVQLPKK
ncbi:MAG: response regulator [Gillisia sp.]